MASAKFQSIFKKIADASATGGGNNIRDGRYQFLVEKCTIQDGHTGTCLIAEFRVMESESSGQVDEQGKPVVPNPVGSTASMVCNITKHESAAGNVKAFVQAALAGLGYTPDQITDDLIGQCFSEENPLRGVKVIDETYRGVNKGRSNAANAGKPLTLNRWKAVEQTEEEVAAGAAYLDDNAATTPKAAKEDAPAKTAETKAETTPATKPAKAGGMLAKMNKGA